MPRPSTAALAALAAAACLLVTATSVVAVQPGPPGLVARLWGGGSPGQTARPPATAAAGTAPPGSGRLTTTASAWFASARQQPAQRHRVASSTLSTLPSLSAARDAALAALREGWDTVRPGGRWHPATFVESRARVAAELALAGAVAWLLAQRAAAPRGRPADAPLSEAEVDALCEEWTPEPLVPASLPDGRPRSAACGGDGPTLLPAPGSRGASTILAASGRRVTAAAGTDFLGLAGDEAIGAAAAGAIAKYGVGSCGPRGFYGTIDVHLALEAALAAWQGTEEAIAYSHDLATMPSVLPAFASAKDVIVLDGAAPWALRNGAALSRARVATFRHGDVSDLEAVLARLGSEDAAARRPPCRRFIVVEGVATHTGGLAPLPQIVALKKKYGYRLVVDESLTAGVLGPVHGRGACEHWGLAPGDADVIVGSLGAALGAAGGWCAASREVVDHQRLSGLGYCFSASLPPFLAVAATEAVKRCESPEGVAGRAALARNAALLRELLAAEGGVPGLVVAGGGGCGGSAAAAPGGGIAASAAAPPTPRSRPTSPTLIAAAGGLGAAAAAAASSGDNGGATQPPATWFAPTLHLVPSSADGSGVVVPTTPSARARAALAVKAIAADCLDRGGVLVAAVEPPPGTDGAVAGPSVRVSLSAAHSADHVRRIAAALRGAGRRAAAAAGGGPASARNSGDGPAAFASPKGGGFVRQESQQSLGGGW